MVSVQDYSTALNQWAAATAAEGKAVPPDRGARCDRAPTPNVARDISASPEARYWGPVIDHLLNQVGLGVLPVIAVAHVPGSLTPVGPRQNRRWSPASARGRAGSAVTGRAPAPVPPPVPTDPVGT